VAAQFGHSHRCSAANSTDIYTPCMLTPEELVAAVEDALHNGPPEMDDLVPISREVLTQALMACRNWRDIDQIRPR
jgi:hypothetical protein